MTLGTVLLQVQSSIGHSDYVRRDQALKGLIQPLAGEYGMHNGQPQGTPSSPLCAVAILSAVQSILVVL